ncbi:unnamed protein product [Rotaria sp. Silwood1]|nr:unnamed protein product [Rotaria sp. Silwood1]
MGRKKRQQNKNVDGYNSTKKQKLPHEKATNRNKSHFEDLANEIIYEIFEYLDVYHVYQGFFYLNIRFQNLLINTNLPIQINIPTMSKTNFELYHQNMIKPNKHRINLLHLSNPFTVDIIFSPPRLILQFIQLETLILDNIDAKYLHNILKHSILLPKLYSLVLTPIDYVQDLSTLFIYIFRLPKLKSCKFTYRTKDDEELLPIFLADLKHSSIEYLVINSRFPFDSLSDFFFCLSNLRYLSINCLVGSRHSDIHNYPIVLKHLKHVSMKLDYIHFNLLKKLIKHFFRHVEVLRLTTQFYHAYLNAKRWQELIQTHMPNLRIFDIHHEDSIEDNHILYHNLMEEFNSLFWIERQWFFAHQHDWQQTLDSGIFYSTNPYRRKDYTFYWELDQQLCPHIQENNLNSVKHVHICSKQARNNCVNYFPNVIELTIKHFFQTSDHSISITLNRMIPLKQLTKLVIESYDFPFEEIVKLLYFTPNLHTLKLDLLPLYKTNLKVFQQNEIFQYVSNRNHIRNLDLRHWCTLKHFRLIMNLFSQVEYLKTGIERKEIQKIIEFLFSKTNNKTHHLFFLCISPTPKICLQELKDLIQSENLLDHYSIKYIKRNLYLWW